LLPPWEQSILCTMRIIAKRTLRQFWESRPRGAEAKIPPEVWHSTVRHTEWKTPADVKVMYGDASILKNNRVVFNLGGNKYRLVVRINYPHGIVYIRFVGTHKEYDEIDAETI
jgi:mRNA interferase HigB